MHIKYGFTCKNIVRFWNGAKIPDNTLIANLVKGQAVLDKQKV